ncbi:hypothetical protein Ga0100231_006260 [Opitutaceae bacterium TAV4]|nr:hypothetical protein Ga0100231_006260 [Opitutaceae bacterium TAV4]
MKTQGRSRSRPESRPRVARRRQRRRLASTSANPSRRRFTPPALETVRGILTKKTAAAKPQNNGKPLCEGENAPLSRELGRHEEIIEGRHTAAKPSARNLELATNSVAAQGGMGWGHRSAVLAAAAIAYRPEPWAPPAGSWERPASLQTRYGTSGRGRDSISVGIDAMASQYMQRGHRRRVGKALARS